MLQNSPPAHLAFVSFLILITVCGSALAQCSLDWTPGFNQRGVSGGISALHVCDLGSGPQLYAGGSLTRENGVSVNHIARWTGSTWAPLGLGMNAGVSTLASANLGLGFSLYAGGNFNLLEGQPSTNVARWSGTNWAPVVNNATNNGAGAIKAWPGTPAALYGVSSNTLSIMTANTWATVATVGQGDLTSIEVFDDGTGPHVYVAGTFTTVNGVPLNRVAKWTGSAWAPLGSGMNDWVSSLAVYDDGTGPALYAGGSFTTAGGVAAPHLAKWNGQSWSSVGGGIPNGNVDALSAQDWGFGSKLLVTGYFTSIGAAAVPANFIASWDGSTFAPLGSGLSSAAKAFAVLDEGSGPALIVGGGFISAGGKAMNYVARWNGTAWSPMPDGNGFNTGSFDFSWVQASTVWDDGNGPALYLAGRFHSVGDCAATRIVKFDGQHWTALGSGINGDVNALAGYDSGTGPALYAGGFFSTAGGVPASNIAKWNGTSWSALGSGLPFPCYSLEPITTGLMSGTLAVGGHFLTAGTVFAPFIAFWNGSTFSSTWAVTNTYPLVEEINAIASFDDGTGPAIYAGGRVCCAGNPSLWKFNGSVWAPSSTTSATIHDLEVFDTGSGPRLYAAADAVVGPSFSFAQLTPAGWTSIPGSLPSTAVLALRAPQDESGSALYLGGRTSAPGQAPAYLARWDGASFSTLGTGPGGLGNAGASTAGPVVNTIASFNDGTGPALYVAGCFTQTGAYQSTLIGRWAARRPTLSLSQSAPGAGVVITNGGLLPGHVYHNVFSLETCPVVGGGPWLGLCAVDPAPLLDQFYLPLGAVPFHFGASTSAKTFGPYGAPPGITLDGVSFDYTGGILGCYSPVHRFTIQ